MQKLSKNLFKKCSSLTSKKYRQIHDRFLIEGPKLIEEAFLSPFRIETVIYRIGTGNQFRSILDLAKKNKSEIFQCTDKEINKLSDVETPQGIFAVAEPPEPLDISFFNSAGLLIAADRISDPGNLGAIIRSAVWFGCGGLIMDSNCVELYSPKVLRAAMGSLFHLPAIYNIGLSEAIGYFNKKGYITIAADAEGTDIKKIKIPDEKIMLVMGNEAHGIREEITEKCCTKAAILKTGRGESLNVSVSAGILLWELSSRISSRVKHGK